MRHIAMVLVIAATAVASGVGAANAQIVEFGVRAPDVTVDPGFRHRHWRERYAYVPQCRTIVRSHWNRWGERVVSRVRECD